MLKWIHKERMIKMKKIIALLLISLMLFSVAPVMAEDAGCEITLTKQNETEKGFDVLFSIKNNPGMGAMTLRINFDKDYIIPVSFEKTGIFASQSVTSNIDAKSGNTGDDINGELRVVWYKTSGLSDNGDMFKVSFEYKSIPESKEANVAINQRRLDVVDKNAEQIVYVTNKVTVTVPADESAQTPENNESDTNKDTETSGDTDNTGTITNNNTNTGNSNVYVPVVDTNKVTLANKTGVSKIKYMPVYSDNTFAPDKPATRYEVIEALYNLVDITATKYEDAFEDVEAKYEMPVKAFITAEILDGYEDKTFKGDNTITRAELVKVLTLTFKLEEDKNATAEFTDIKDHWAESYINTFVSEKYTYGYEDNTFRPENNVTRAEVVAFVNRIIDASGDLSGNIPVDLDSNHWAYNDILKSVK